MSGSVALVGAGPGDPGLITVRGLSLLRSCDALVYDRLVARELVDEAPSGALRVSREPLAQDEINALLVRLARRGLAVVRLKGGDPFLFGRGGEEALHLAAHGVDVEVVPGVSALAAVPAAAAIPVTHRGVSSQVTAVTGHGPLDLAALAATPGTLVVFMGLGRLDEIARGLVAHGRDADTPAAVIAHGTLPGQRVVRAPLGRLAAAAAGVEPPALVVVGEVASLADRLGGSRRAVAA
ncbi:MAG TPA: uroporphyrinogen-III C-methyltransferase [Gaiellaceae bacterium]|nr:uroporphyrinogen-III C-methyltransferase [Gaiellaceae bacterium]